MVFSTNLHIFRDLCFHQKKYKVEKSGWAEVLMNERWQSNTEQTEMLFEIASPMVSVVWEKIQKENQCCGLAGQSDWIDSDFQKIPQTCCNSGKALTPAGKVTN